MSRLPLKRALLIGINYTDTDAALAGCINDVQNVRDYLIEEAGFHACQITVMSDNLSKDSRHYPTRANILTQMQSVAAEITQEGDLLYFHYSGHGSYQRQGWLKRWFVRDELDGQDETICPVDCDSAGMIVDDELRRLLVDALPDGAILRAVFDCCHSGTLIDLRYNYRLDEEKRETLTKNSAISSTRCDALMLSGCLDAETSADARIDGKASGALTAAFLKTIRKYGETASCKRLLRGIHRYLAREGFPQRPQFSSGQRLDWTHAKFLPNNEITD